VENRLLEHPAVREAVVVGVTNEDGLTKPCACVLRAEPAEGDDATLEADLQAFVRDGLAAYKYPRRVLFLEDLPRTHLGKVDRGAVRAMFDSG